MGLDYQDVIVLALVLVSIITLMIFSDVCKSFDKKLEFQKNKDYIMHLTYQSVTAMCMIIITVAMCGLGFVGVHQKQLILKSADITIGLMSMLLTVVWSIPLFMAFSVKISRSKK